MTAFGYGVTGAEMALVPTGVKTGAYTAAVGDLVPCDISAGGFTVKLPNGPANGTRVGAKATATNAAGTNLLTLACQGTDRINEAGGAVTLTLQLHDQGTIVQYDSGIWYVVDDSLPLGALRKIWTDWISVLSRGAVGDGTTDDTTAIQAALTASAATGAPAYLPGANAAGSPAVYLTTRPLSVPSGASLLGPHGRLVNGTAGGPAIRPSSSWSGGTAVISLASGQEQELGGFTIDCSALSSSATIDGIAGAGSTINLYLHDLMVLNAPRTGIAGNFNGNTWRLRKVTVFGTGTGPGYNLADLTDITADDCESIASAAQGFYLAGNSNCTFTACRAEWSGGGFGWQLDGNLGYGMRLVGCSTDRNAQHGLLVSATGADPVVISGCVFRRDGRSSGSAGYAGITVAAGVTNPLVIDGCAIYTGTDDDGTGTPSPQYGISVSTSGAPPTAVLLTGVYANGVTAATIGVTAANGCSARNVIGQAGQPPSGAVTQVSTPAGPLAAPSVPASGTPLTSPFSEPCTIYLAAASGSTAQVAVAGTHVITIAASGTGTIRLSPGQTITLTYTAAPAWAWTGD